LSTIPVIKLKQKNTMISNDRSSYFILSMFFSHFQLVLVAKRRSIRAIAYDFGTFVMFTIFESVILVFPKHVHSNFRRVFEVIHEEIM